jgi:hypothetical protein
MSEGVTLNWTAKHRGIQSRRGEMSALVEKAILVILHSVCINVKGWKLTNKETIGVPNGLPLSEILETDWVPTA